jgi:hypothetical protein
MSQGPQTPAPLGPQQAGLTFQSAASISTTPGYSASTSAARRSSGPLMLTMHPACSAAAIPARPHWALTCVPQVAASGRAADTAQLAPSALAGVPARHLPGPAAAAHLGVPVVVERLAPPVQRPKAGDLLPAEGLLVPAGKHQHLHAALHSSCHRFLAAGFQPQLLRRNRMAPWQPARRRSSGRSPRRPAGTSHSPMNAAL